MTLPFSRCRIWNSFFLSLFILAALMHTVYASQSPDRKEKEPLPLVLVSVPPYSDIVQTLCGNQAQVVSIVSASMSSHTFEPSPKQTFSYKDACLWFGIGENFEAKMLESLQKSLKSHIVYVNLKKEIEGQIRDMVYTYPSLEHGCSCCHGGAHHHHHFHEEAGKESFHHRPHLNQLDPHIWMSPPLMIDQISLIATAIKKTLPSIDQLAVESRASDLIEKCRQLETEANKRLLPQQGKSILTAHSAYGYLLAPYDIKQYEIEQEGKEPSPQRVTALISLAKEEKIKAIFTQSQYPSKAASVMAKSLSFDTDGDPVNVVELNPYSKDYFSSMNEIIGAFAQSLQMQSPRSDRDEDSDKEP